MRTAFSKPLADVSKEFERIRKIDLDCMAAAQRAVDSLARYPKRTVCTVCRGSLAGAEVFLHRGVEYLQCPDCDHIMLSCQPPSDYPPEGDGDLSFDAIYPPLSAAQAADRRSRVYEPKLRWIIDAATEAGLTRSDLLSRSWMELGCGEGLFLSCLEDVGVRRVSGCERNPFLARRAAEILARAKVEAGDVDLARRIKDSDVDVFAAFFVFEHVPDLHSVFSAFSTRPQGTLVALSVPVFSLSTLLEHVISGHAARSLDGAVHTQLFTTNSLDRCLRLGGLKPLAQWVFGQDASDLRRLLLLALDGHCPQALLSEADEALRRLEDPLQHAVDEGFFCDARHILAVRDDG
ncbi:class I SAM-dependent methyltransferase [Desulfocurvus sp. DL9XJH121]